MDYSQFRRSNKVTVRPPGVVDPTDQESPEEAMNRQMATEEWLDEAERHPHVSTLANQLGAKTVDAAARQVHRDAVKKDIAENGEWSTFDEKVDPNGPPKRLKREPMPLPRLMSSAGNPTHDAIIRAAREDGVDPAFALAVAERESNFDPAAKSSKTIRGMYQMRGDLRAKYGSGDSPDPYEQAKGWTKSLPDIKRDMGGVLGRDATDQESYLGHHFGARRAARMLRMDPSTPVDAVFTPQEMGLNPHFARAGTVGNLNGSVMGDIGKRMARFGGSDAAPTEPADLSSFGQPVEASVTAPSQTASLDLSGFGTPAGGDNGAAPPPATAAATSAPDLSMFGQAA